MTQQQTKIRCQPFWYLIFWFLVVYCNPRENHGDFAIRWENGKAVSVFIPDASLKGLKDRTKEITVNIKDYEVAILGETAEANDGITFKPLIPFTRGMSYDIRQGQNLLGSFRVPLSDSSEFPDIVAVYPQSDSIPANLLKWYIHFSQPMQEGVSADYVHLIRNETDTLKNVFLDLQPELWNHEQHVLTVWMDPGRIKRGLQPNLNLGPPMTENLRYQLIIDSSWRDVHGNRLRKNFSKTFFTKSRDSISPDPARWKIITPKAGTKNTIQIEFPESMDHLLLENTMVVSDPQGKLISGQWKALSLDKRITFTPDNAWKQGAYQLLIDSRLEDLAGNNLNRLFDEDLTVQPQKKSEEEFRLTFRID